MFCWLFEPIVWWFKISFLTPNFKKLTTDLSRTIRAIRWWWWRWGSWCGWGRPFVWGGRTKWLDEDWIGDLWAWWGDLIIYRCWRWERASGAVWIWKTQNPKMGWKNKSAIWSSSAVCHFTEVSIMVGKVIQDSKTTNYPEPIISTKRWNKKIKTTKTQNPHWARQSWARLGGSGVLWGGERRKDEFEKQDFGI